MSAGRALTSEPWFDADRGTVASGKLSGLELLVIPRPAAQKVPPAAGRSDPADAGEVRQVIVGLHRAQATAPKGFVGLKVFRDRLLMPGESRERRAAVLQAAIDANAIAVQSVADPASGAPVTTLALVREHPAVREVLAAADCGLPALIDVPGDALSATVIAARETER